MFNASPLKKFSKFINKKDTTTFVFIIIIIGSILFAASKIFPNYRETTAQDYLYFNSSHGLLGIGRNTLYEIGSINNSQKYNKRLEEVSNGSEYNVLDDSIYVLDETSCVVSVLKRDGHRDELNYCPADRGRDRYRADSIYFDQKNYKYVILNGGFGGEDKYVTAIAIFNEKQQLIKTIVNDFFIESLVIINDKVIYSQREILYGDEGVSKYLITYDLKTNKRTIIDYSKKYKDLDYIIGLLQLDNDYLVLYADKKQERHVMNSKGKIIKNIKQNIDSTRPSYYINKKWYLNVSLSDAPKYESELLVEYTKDSFKTISYLETCDYYNSLIYNNKSVYCVSKKDNKKIVSLLDNDKNIYKLDKKYEYGSYHRLALFGFK